MIIGNKVFSIESYISSVNEHPSIRGLGYFIINIKNQVYGIKDDEATLLACSYDSMVNRFFDFGKHIISEEINIMDGLEIAEYFEKILYDERYKSDGRMDNKIKDMIYHNKLVLAPDGDEAFDDGSRIFQFDIKDKVRLIGYKSLKNNIIDRKTLTDLIIDAGFFYETINDWSDSFLKEWDALARKGNL
jgi:hypothetical protein